MSLINTMLKDLEKRESSQHKISYITLKNKNSKSYFMKIISLGLLLLIVMASFYSLFFNKKTMKVMPLQNNEIVNHSSQPRVAVDPEWITPVSINGVSLQVKDNITEIIFSLNHAALYRLVSDESQNQLSIIVDRSELQSELPSTEYLNTAIEKMTTQTTHGDTKFRLSLIPGATLKYVNLNNTNKNAELIVAIEYLPINHEASLNQSEKSIKSPINNDILSKKYQSALLLAENGNYQSAIRHLTSLLKIDPNFKDARMSLIALLIDQGSPVKAKRLVEEGLNENPDYVPFIELKARILATEGKSKQALELLQTASPPIDENPDYHAFVAALYEQNDNFSLAVNLYKQLLALNSSNGSWWFGLGVSLDKLGKKKDAIDAYNRASAEGHLSHESLAYLQTRLQKLQEVIDAKE